MATKTDSLVRSAYTGCLVEVDRSDRTKRFLCAAAVNGPRETYAAGSTVHGRFRQWVQQGVKTLLRIMIVEMASPRITKAPLGGEDTGPSPVDRRKMGTKRSVLTDQRGAPLRWK